MVATTVKGHAPGIAYTPRVDPRSGCGPPNKWVIRRNRVRLAIAPFTIDVDPENLAQMRCQILGVASRAAIEALVICISPVPDGDIEETVRTKSHPAAIMVEIRFV